MFYSHRQCKITINNAPLFVEEASISCKNALSSNTLVGYNDPAYSVGNTDVNGTLFISYYLTGNDFIKNNLLSNSSIPVKCNFGGLYFESGFVSSYSIDFLPNAPVKANAEVVFWGDLNGGFSPNTERISRPNFLNFSDCVIDSNFLSSSGIRKISWKSNVENIPDFQDDLYAKNIVGPNSVLQSKKESICEISCNELERKIGYSGTEGYLSVSICNKYKEEVDDIFVSGNLNSRTLSVAQNSVLESSYTLRQENINNYGPEISGFSKLNPILHEPVLISGRNLEGFVSILYGQEKMSSALLVKIKNIPYIRFSINSVYPSGKITVITSRGRDTSDEYISIDNGGIGEF